MALALVLLIGSGLMVRSFQSMRKVNPGFSEPAALQTFRISTPRNDTTKDAEVLVMQQNLVERLTALSGTLLFGIKPIDPLTYITVAITLLAATAVASYLPARRITRVNPVDALRAE